MTGPARPTRSTSRGPAGRRAALCALLAVWATVAEARQRTVEVYRARERPAEELVGLDHLETLVHER